MEQTIMQLVTAFLGALGFCIVFRLRRTLLIAAALGGMVTWGVYLLAAWKLGGIFVPNLLAAAFGALYAEVLARMRRAPATLFCIPAVIPLVPGSLLFSAMSFAVWGQWEESRAYAIATVRSALAIAVGMSVVWAVSSMVRRAAKKE